ncbi:MAG: DedA family protein [Comamonadaceae bacterium]|nr:MAG: DedA family protein [Comamonadaceae bacterium]
MTDWIISFIEDFGYGGIVVLMLLENIFPPIPSELIMPFAGFAAARAQLHPLGVVLAGMAGSVLGTLPWYWAGRKLGLARLKTLAARHGRWLTMSPHELDEAQRWFKKHGAPSVMLGRVVPGVRSVISMPAGIAKMPLAAFLLWSCAGSLLWSALLAGLGFVLESRYEEVKVALEWVTRAVVGTLVAAYVWRVVTFGRDKQEKAA